MITIFRKIRQKLIADKRASKYLLYAIGEILLVLVIERSFLRFVLSVDKIIGKHASSGMAA